MHKDSLLVRGTNGATSLVGVWWGQSDYAVVSPKEMSVAKSSKKGSRGRKKADGKALAQDGTASSVAVWFHGGMTSGNCEKGLVAGNDLAALLPDFTVISVSACKESHWVTPIAVEWVDAALDSVAARRKVPVDIVYLIGVSDGALGVIAYSMEGRHKVVARTLISSYGSMLGTAEEVAGNPRLQSGKWNFLQGGSDRLYPSQETVPWIENFCRTVGKSCYLNFDQKGEHDWTYWKGGHKDWILKLFKEK